MNVFILASGRTTPGYWTRFDLPKSLISIRGNTILDYQIDRFNKAKIDINIILGYKAQTIIDHCDKRGYHYVKFLFDDGWEGLYNSLRTLSDLKYKILENKEPFIVTYGDLLFNSNVVKALVEAEGDMCRITSDSSIIKFTPKGFKAMIELYESLPSKDTGNRMLWDPLRKMVSINDLPYMFVRDIDNQTQYNDCLNNWVTQIEACNDM